MAERVIDYGIIESDSFEELAEEVRNQLREGWEPQGGVCAFYGNSKTWYVQALVKREPEQ